MTQMFTDKNNKKLSVFICVICGLFYVLRLISFKYEIRALAF